MGSSAGAIQSIWNQWSMNDIVRTPMASARWASSPTPGPIPEGPPAQSKRETWRSSCMCPSYPVEKVPSSCRISSVGSDTWVTALKGRPTGKDGEMRFMLLKHYAPVESGAPTIWEWSPEDFKAHIDFQHAHMAELTATGELVEAQGLAGPDQVKVVTFQGKGAPVVTDGPYTESKELLAG